MAVRRSETAGTVPAGSRTEPGTGSTGSGTRILQAAHHCFSHYGFQKTSMEDIAREAGVSRGSVYRHFPDKDSLFRAVSQQQAEAFLDEMQHRTARIADLGGQIDEIARMTLEYLRDDPINAAMARTDPDAFARAITTGGFELLAMATEAVVPLVEAAVERGEVRADLDTRRGAEWITRIVFSLVSTPSVTFDRDDPAQRQAFLRDFLVPGLS